MHSGTPRIDTHCDPRAGERIFNFVSQLKPAVDFIVIGITLKQLLRILKQQDGEITAFNEKLWCGLLDYATAYADGRLTFTFKNGSTFEG